EDKTEKVEEIIQKYTGLKGKALEDAVLNTLWRWREKTTNSPPPSRHTVIRKGSPAPWQITRTPTPSQSSPRMPPPGFGIAPPGFQRAKSSAASPSTSPRPSPRLAMATPHIPGSPSLNAYKFSDPASAGPEYGDYGSDAVDWLVNDETGSIDSSFAGEMPLNGAAAEWIQPQTVDMTPQEMLRSIFPPEVADDEIERTLEENGFDLSATINALMGSQGLDQQGQVTEPERTYLVGKSMTPTFRPSTPVGQQKSHILCKYWLATGHCARADCRFSHDSSKTVC
ncbi:hypothetical protein LTS18_001859, partial [Coniosporium uncinatum]